MKPNSNFPGSIKTRRPRFSDHRGRTWDYCKIVGIDGSSVEGRFDTSWGFFAYFDINGQWYKVRLIDDRFDGYTLNLNKPKP